MNYCSWKVGTLAAAISLALLGVARADDDVVRLERQKPAADEFRYADRAKADADDDLEDIHFRYNLGYYRGSNGGQYSLPRFYAFRHGFTDGSSGAGYHGGLAGRAYSGSGYAGAASPMTSVAAAPNSRISTSNYASPSPRPIMSDPEPPLAPAAPSYENLAPPSPAAPRMSEPAPTIAGDERVVSTRPSKKYSYAAYGENRSQTKDPETLAVKENK
jgi:hypothetical protein